MEKIVYDHKEIMALIPHRYPFLLVDRVIEFVKEPPFIRAIKNLTLNEPFFQGHFPGEPVMPGVLMIEALAQLGIIFFKTLFPDHKDRFFMLAGVDKARFRTPVYPGDMLVLELEGYKIKRDILKTKGRALVNEKLAAEAEIIAVIR